ncbi:MAG TPA: ABC transporter ATP-binding protein [Oscillatoriales cyanobacterium M59_W2019_021]|nr:MAG: ABC transporter ATP-binding protein [Cyanobacteria bacterium J055]HIK32018.1 ABC transporter ATP-binding protein [Oscillatoriales cyanobacterium M4454_W2019_049]HIK51332.1 ABC transporter ATP-binding protein [Oscillatoriales cyanobacterium M59_W2019_021]
MPVASPIEPTGDPRPIAVWAEGIRKRYRTGFWLNQTIESLAGCSLEVYRGETFGLLGPNGAGKTTLLKILLGIVRPTSGRGGVFGYPLGNRRARYRVGYLPENPYFYDYLTAWEFLEFAAGLFEIPASVRRQRIPETIDLVRLDRSTARQKPLKQYSKGMLQRLGMAQALIADPDVLFLDEPMSGLDPMGRYQMRETILALKERGKTIFFNSHILADVEKICDRVAILARGDLICSGSLGDLLGTEDRYQVRGRGGQLDMLKEWMPTVRLESNYWQGELQGNVEDFLASLRLMDAQLVSLSLTRPTLEEFFLQKLQEVGIAESR